MKPDQVALYAGIGALFVGIFLIDVQMALGFTPWLLYVIPLGLTYWATHRAVPFVTVALSTVLIFVGYELSPPTIASESIALTNRTIGAFTFWALAFLISGYKTLAQRLSHHTEQLKRELMERTQDLGRAVSALRAATESGSGRATDLSGAEDEFRIQISEVLASESRRLQDKVVDLEQEHPPVQGEEDGLERTRNELLQLGRQLERLQRDLLSS
ncbi:hypothetical protein [Petrachloros mirabilis]